MCETRVLGILGHSDTPSFLKCKWLWTCESGPSAGCEKDASETSQDGPLEELGSKKRM